MIQRGDVWWADLGTPSGADPGFRRPVVIVQADAFNRSRLQTVVAIALTSNLRLVEAPGNVIVPREVSGLPRDSVANISQVVTLDRSELSERERRLPPLVMRAIDRGLRLVLDL